MKLGIIALASLLTATGAMGQGITRETITLDATCIESNNPNALLHDFENLLILLGLTATKWDSLTAYTSGEIGGPLFLYEEATPLPVKQWFISKSLDDGRMCIIAHGLGKEN